MDNLRVHKCKQVMDTMKELDIEPIWAPIYSPDYNPIEFVFAQMKGIVKRMRLQDMLKERKRSFKELIPLALAQIDEEKIDMCIEHVYDLYE